MQAHQSDFDAQIMHQQQQQQQQQMQIMQQQLHWQQQQQQQQLMQAQQQQQQHAQAQAQQSGTEIKLEVAAAAGGAGPSSAAYVYPSSHLSFTQPLYSSSHAPLYSAPLQQQPTYYMQPPPQPQGPTANSYFMSPVSVSPMTHSLSHIPASPLHPPSSRSNSIIASATGSPLVASTTDNSTPSTGSINKRKQSLSGIESMPDPDVHTRSHTRAKNSHHRHTVDSAAAAHDSMHSNGGYATSPASQHPTMVYPPMQQQQQQQAAPIPLPLPALGGPYPAASASTSYAATRRHKHKEVEVRRRRRISLLFHDLAELLELGPTDKASVLAIAAKFIRRAKERGMRPHKMDIEEESEQESESTDAPATPVTPTPAVATKPARSRAKAQAASAARASSSSDALNLLSSASHPAAAAAASSHDPLSLLSTASTVAAKSPSMSTRGSAAAAAAAAASPSPVEGTRVLI